MKVAAIVPAAGKGVRIKSKIEKPYIEINKIPLLAHTLLRLSKNKNISEIIVAVSKKHINKVEIDVIKKFRIKKVKLVSGGRERKHSVYNALCKVSDDVDYILVHDGARPNITKDLIDSSLKAAQDFGASVVCVPVKATLKYAGKNRNIKYTPKRENFWEAQTPQVFRKDLIVKAYKKYRNKNKITDDAMLVELMGVKPKVVLGSYNNIKVTTKEDLELLKILL
ncbi:MAG: 2-C-methyl-D-erythritol 4-phosphate cytidylyltransferase [Candidatus Omnitrophota bacterium]|nr:2-C-methyl-D-erythritol 4-phosphate cytidylyltransferase [Candidatus Omnitrophota bacterium]